MTAPHLRIGYRERGDAVARLTAHAAAGRLDVAELERRLDAAQRAVHAHELRALEADLPAPAPAPPPRFAFPALVVAAIALTVAVSVLVGHPVPPVFVVGLLLWRVLRRRFLLG